MSNGRVNDPANVTYPKFGACANLETEPQSFIFTLLDGSPVWSAQQFTTLQMPVIPEDTSHILVSMPVGQRFASGDAQVKYTEGDGPKKQVYVQVCGPDMGRDQTVTHEGRLVGTRRLVHYGQCVLVQNRT